MHTKRSIVLVSGGLDSCVTAAIAHREGYHLSFLHVNYGQRTEVRELKAFRDITNHYRVSEHLVADIGYLKEIGGSSLVDKSMAIEKNQPLTGTSIPSTYVPFRNTHLLAIATSWAETIQAETIFIGAVEEDSSGYPDCRSTFFNTFNQLIKDGTRPETKITIQTPLIKLTKKDIVLKAIELEAPLYLTWSCYERSRKACGACDSCILRLRGFKEAGIEDPLPYLSER
jgi:7-cyano-7-deazaguanine synthase